MMESYARAAAALLFVGACAGVAPRAAVAPRATICAGHPLAIDDRGRVAWSESSLAGGENGAEILTYDDRNRIAIRTIRVDDALTIAPCQGRWTFGPLPCAFASNGYQVVEYDDRYTYDDRRRPIAKVRTTWLVGPFSIHQRPDPAGPRARVSVAWVRWSWTENEPTTIEAGEMGATGAELPTSPERYHLQREATRIFLLSSYDAANQPMGDAPRARVTPPPAACVEDRAPPGLGWGTIELDRRDRIVRIEVPAFAHEVIAYDDRSRVALRTSRVLHEGESQMECSGSWTGENPTCTGLMVSVATPGWWMDVEDRYLYDAERRPIARWRTTWSLRDRGDARPIGVAPRGQRGPSEWVRWIWRGDEPIEVEIGTERGTPGTRLPPSDLATHLLDEARHVRWLGAPHPE